MDVAAAFFALQESAGFVIVGGAALHCLELIDRLTEDLAFFTEGATRVRVAGSALTVAADRKRVASRGGSNIGYVLPVGVDV